LLTVINELAKFYGICIAMSDDEDCPTLRQQALSDAGDDVDSRWVHACMDKSPTKFWRLCCTIDAIAAA